MNPSVPKVFICGKIFKLQIQLISLFVFCIYSCASLDSCIFLGSCFIEILKFICIKLFIIYFYNLSNVSESITVSLYFVLDISYLYLLSDLFIYIFIKIYLAYKIV